MDVTTRRRKNKVVDVSCFLLFEATGDSESDGNLGPAMADHHINHIEDADDDDDGDEDAESCSCSTSNAPGVRVRKIYSLGNISGNVHDDEDDDDDDDGDGVVEQKDVELYKKYCRDDERIVAKEKKASSSSTVSIENPKETMNEMEKNRLFWEACLAS